MATNDYHSNLKQKLRASGAIQPAAWLLILEHKQETYLNQGESFIRKEDSLAYVACGLLKEYAPQNRKTPAIVNFLKPNTFLITRRFNQQQYLKSCTPTVIYHWNFASLEELFHNFKELKPVYHLLCAEYDGGIAFRMLILEELLAMNRIKLFIDYYREHLNFMRKKDIANYLLISYDTFIRQYRLLI